MERRLKRQLLDCERNLKRPTGLSFLGGIKMKEFNNLIEVFEHIAQMQSDLREINKYLLSIMPIKKVGLRNTKKVD